MKISNIIENSQRCPHCGGPIVTVAELDEGKKDACYYKIKASSKVWPSAYASGRLVQCRKKGAANYGNKSEGVADGSEQIDELSPGTLNSYVNKARAQVRASPGANPNNSHLPTDPKIANRARGAVKADNRLNGFGPVNKSTKGVADGVSDKFSVYDKVEEVVEKYQLFDNRGWTDLFAKLAGRKLDREEIYQEMKYASKFLQLLDSIRMRSDYRGQQDPKKDQELIDLSNQWIDLFKQATSEFKAMSSQGVAEGLDELARVLELSGLNLTADQQFDMIELMVESLALEHGVDAETIWEDFESVDDEELFETAAWRRKEGKSAKGGLNARGVASYRRENPGSKLQTAVTTKPSKLKPGSKAAKRRKSFCARMGGVKGPMKKPNGKPTRKALALRKWNC